MGIGTRACEHPARARLPRGCSPLSARHRGSGYGRSAVSDLSASGVVTYLLDRKLLSPRAVVDGGLRVEDVSRSNPVFVVIAEGERCYAVKLAGAAGVTREAA